MIAEPHAYSVPPQVTASRIDPTLADEQRGAQVVDAVGDAPVGRSSTTLVTTSATAPTGRFT